LDIAGVLTTINSTGEFFIAETVPLALLSALNNKHNDRIK
jgi:hypothetical protein